jgi:hypothetical protein
MLLAGTLTPKAVETPGLGVEWLIQETRKEVSAGNEVRARVMKSLQHALHAACMINWIYVFDKEAIETGKLLMV